MRSGKTGTGLNQIQNNGGNTGQTGTRHEPTPRHQVCNIINVFTVTFDQFNVSSLIKIINFFTVSLFYVAYITIAITVNYA